MPSIDRDAFVAERQEGWEELEHLLAVGLRTPEAVSRAASAYRRVAADLATAQTADLPDDVQTYLDGLAGRAHHQIYGTRAALEFHPLRLLLEDFPRELRAQSGFFIVATVLFGLPFVIGAVSCALDPDLAANVLPPSQLEQMAEMYSEPTARGGADADSQMAGFYVLNNIGIAFRTFATGVFAGLGSLFFLIYNGATLGTVFGYLFGVGRGFNLAVFTSGHAAWELTGIVIAGAAGLRLGWALLVTEGLTRTASLRAAGPVLFRLVAGAAAFIFIAALVEGFWSASPVPWPAKFVFGAVQWAVVLLWLGLAGREVQA